LSALWRKLADLIAAGDVRVSEHGYDALADDGLGIDKILSGVPQAVVLEEVGGRKEEVGKKEGKRWPSLERLG
jgi:hypothetical protein